VKSPSEERRLTGLREAALLGQTLAQGRMALSKRETTTSWAADPQHPDFQAEVLRNQAEDKRQDKDFPDHSGRGCGTA
jgi:hypothetical protein